MVTLTETTALDRMLDPVAEILTPDVARRIAELRADPELQTRLDELATMANQGRLTEADRREYAAIVDAIDFVGILQAKARAVLDRTTSA
jgi:hypothetical protein